LFAFMIGASSCNDNHTTGEMVALDIDSLKNIKPIGTTEILAGLVVSQPIIDTPPKLTGKPAIHKQVIVEKPILKGDINIVEQPMLMGEPAVVEQPTLMGDTVIQNTTEKLPACKPIKVKETEFVMGKMIAPKIVKTNKK
jgi:hypothetical protein